MVAAKKVLDETAERLGYEVVYVAADTATDVLLGAFKGRKDVTLMGTPSGGTSTRARTIRMANSGISLKLASAASFAPDGMLYDGKGVQPDVEAWPDPTDLIGRTDTVLDGAALKLQKN